MVAGGVGAGGVVTGVVVTFTAGAGVAVVAFRTGAGVVGVVADVAGVAGVSGVVVMVLVPIGTVTAGMENPANDVLDNTDAGVVADA
jgi:hypothetical protein